MSVILQKSRAIFLFGDKPLSAVGVTTRHLCCASSQHVECTMNRDGKLQHYRSHALDRALLAVGDQIRSDKQRLFALRNPCTHACICTARAPRASCVARVERLEAERTQTFHPGPPPLLSPKMLPVSLHPFSRAGIPTADPLYTDPFRPGRIQSIYTCQRWPVPCPCRDLAHDF